MFRFDDSTFDPATGELRGPRGVLRLQPQPAHLLTMLLQANGDLVERERIRAAVWPQTNVDFRASLNTCVRQVRTALCHSGGEAEYIETLPKRGYRFTAAVAVDRPGIEPQGRVTRMPKRARAHAIGPYVAAVALIATGVAVTVGWQLGGTKDDTAASGAGGVVAQAGAAPAAARLAVVPFDDPVSDANAAFNRDLTEAFVSALVNAAPDDIVVIGPSTTAQYFAEGLSLPDIAGAVGADFVLHGGHRSSAGIFFVEVVLPDGEHLFARRLDLDLGAAAVAPPKTVTAMTASMIEAWGHE